MLTAKRSDRKGWVVGPKGRAQLQAGLLMQSCHLDVHMCCVLGHCSDRMLHSLSVNKLTKYKTSQAPAQKHAFRLWCFMRWLRKHLYRAVYLEALGL